MTAKHHCPYCRREIKAYHPDRYHEKSACKGCKVSEAFTLDKLATPNQCRCCLMSIMSEWPRGYACASSSVRRLALRAQQEFGFKLYTTGPRITAQLKAYVLEQARPAAHRRTAVELALSLASQESSCATLRVCSKGRTARLPLCPVLVSTHSCTCHTPRAAARQRSRRVRMADVEARSTALLSSDACRAAHQTRRHAAEAAAARPLKDPLRDGAVFAGGLELRSSLPNHISLNAHAFSARRLYESRCGQAGPVPSVRRDGQLARRRAACAFERVHRPRDTRSVREAAGGPRGQSGVCWPEGGAAGGCAQRRRMQAARRQRVPNRLVCPRLISCLPRGRCAPPRRGSCSVAARAERGC